MFIKVIDTGVVSKFQRETTKKLLLRCDNCQVEFERRYTRLVSERKHHFCSNDCKFKLRAEKDSSYSRYVEEKRATSNLLKYGATTPWGSSEGQKHRQTLMLQKYGVVNNMHRQDVLEKVKTYNREKFGCDFPLQSDEIRLKTILSYQSQNHSISRSSCEKYLEEKLVSVFGREDVEVGKWVSGWCIDFYIRSSETYVQVDGVYWHGLDRPIQDIKSSQINRDKHIYNVWKKDRKQNAFFKSRGMRLVRITDEDLRDDVKLADFLSSIKVNI